MIFVFVWLISPSITPSKSTHAVTNGKVPFFFMAKVGFLYIF